MRSCCVAMIFGSLLAMLGCVREGAGPEVEVDVKAAPTGLLRLSGECRMLSAWEPPTLRKNLSPNRSRLLDG